MSMTRIMGQAHRKGKRSSVPNGCAFTIACSMTRRSGKGNVVGA